MKKSDLTGSFFMISSKSRVVRFIQMNLILGRLCYNLKKLEFQNHSVLLYQFWNSTAAYYTILKSFIIYDHFKNLTYSNHLWSPCQISKYLKRYASDYFWLSIFGPCLRERDKASNKRNWRIKSSMLIITRKLAPSNIPLNINPTNLSAVLR